MSFHPRKRSGAASVFAAPDLLKMKDSSYLFFVRRSRVSKGEDYR